MAFDYSVTFILLYSFLSVAAVSNIKFIAVIACERFTYKVTNICPTFPLPYDIAYLN